MPETAIILAGGFGTRLRELVPDVPKPMALVNGQPFLSYQLRYLKQHGLKNIILSVGHKADTIRQYYGSAFEGLSINYSLEATPLGTGGGIRLAMAQCSDNTILVLNGDSYFDIDLAFMERLHKEHGSECSLALRRVQQAARYGTIELGADNRITAFREKNGAVEPGFINGGVYLINKDVFLQNTPASGAFSVEKDFFEKQAGRIRLSGFEFNGYFIDIGIPEDYLQAQHDFERFKYQ